MQERSLINKDKNLSLGKSNNLTPFDRGSVMPSTTNNILIFQAPKLYVGRSPKVLVTEPVQWTAQPHSLESCPVTGQIGTAIQLLRK